ncbi:hypothetical protein Taro_031689 [Colocasia esculenta]|uniref:Uncharacterized protein n=1 Tax=Colocasia esculenta TaxID=4460 RepID=A0A843VQN5_COLES|nr:hypothetical protein [Colocasia esculenta]
MEQDLESPLWPPKSFFWKCMGSLAFGVQGTWVDCVNPTRECVDTLSHLRKTGLLGTGSSVDTLTGYVDTLSQSGNWVFWNLGLVSTLPGAVSTHLTINNDLIAITIMYVT